MDSHRPYGVKVQQEFLSAREVATVLGVSRDTVLRRFRGRPGVINLGDGAAEGIFHMAACSGSIQWFPVREVVPALPKSGTRYFCQRREKRR